MSISILVDENIPYLAESLQSCGNVIQFQSRAIDNDFIKHSDTDILFVRSTTKVNEALLNKTSIKLVGTATAGIDHIDIEYLKKNNIQFVSAPGSNANSVAEYVIFSILFWCEKKKISITGKSIAIIGFGNVGKLVAKYSNLLGLKIYVNDPPLLELGFSFPDYCTYKDIDDIITSADIITNHVPLIDSGLYPTSNLLNKDRINKIQNGSLFLHTSRGGIADEEAIINKTKKGDIVSVVDVWNNEPYCNPELADLALIATPHIAGYSRDGKLKGSLALINAFEKYTNQIANKTKILIELSEYSPIDETEFKSHSALLERLSKSRSLENDSVNFKNSLAFSIEDRGAAFDLHRKDYPIRREIL
jgi:erythronate-4-phosphate dehydrogenase